MTSEAWELLTPRQQAAMQELIATINMHKSDRTRRLASKSKSATASAMEHASTVSVTVDPPEVVEARLNAWMLEVYGRPLLKGERPRPQPKPRLTQQLVVEDMPRATRLDNIYTAIAADPAFKHLREVSNFVPGDGPWPSPKALIIGEAPGQQEDEHRRPFIGKSGHMLESMMFECGLTRADVFITNVVKYRPPQNRTPSRDEIEDSIPHLRKEVACVMPQGGLIITLGSVALDVVDQDKKIGQCHGEPWVKDHGIKWTFMPLWHPSYVLQNRAPRQQYIEDWRKVKGLLNG